VSDDDDVQGRVTVNTLVTDWLRRPQDGPFSAVVEENGARWQITAHAEGSGLLVRAELSGLGAWGLGRRIVATEIGPRADD